MAAAPALAHLLALLLALRRSPRTPGRRSASPSTPTARSPSAPRSRSRRPSSCRPACPSRRSGPTSRSPTPSPACPSAPPTRSPGASARRAGPASPAPGRSSRSVRPTSTSAPPPVAVTYADPATNAPVEASVAVPAIAFSATVPRRRGRAWTPSSPPPASPSPPRSTACREAAKPGDAFTLTLTTRAAGPPALLLPPLAGRLPTPAGLRAYPRQPVLTDDPPAATRTEAVAYVIERPGRYELPAVTLDWWNTAASARETAATAPVTIDVPPPAGWRDPDAPGGGARRLPAIAAAILATALLAWLALRRRGPRPPSERRLYRALRRAIRSGPDADIRPRLADWRAALPAPAPTAAVEDALRALDRLRYGPQPSAASDAEARGALLAAVARMRAAAAAPAAAPLLPLNP